LSSPDQDLFSGPNNLSGERVFFPAGKPLNCKGFPATAIIFAKAGDESNCLNLIFL